jgi:hypothetical protein
MPGELDAWAEGVSIAEHERGNKWAPEHLIVPPSGENPVIWGDLLTA